MRIIMASTVPALCIVALLGRSARSDAPKGPPAPTGHYCNMGVFSPAGLKRFHELVERMVAATGESRELDNGYLFKFDASYQESGEWLDGVRRCCPTIAFQVNFTPHTGPAELRVTGDNEAKVFIREEFHRLFGKKG
jgi:hypothetical protein